jgi:hemerythrin-like domain-containing protein
MLTATYTLVALSVEQASIRMGLLSLQKYVHVNLMQPQSITLGQLEYAFETLNRLYQACRWRKSEIYLIPAIRLATEQANHLLDELSTLNASAADMLHGLRLRLGNVGAYTEECVEKICSSIDACCSTLLKRLEKEESELFAMARSVICGESWFSIANQFLRHDEKEIEARRSKASVSELPLALPARFDLTAGVDPNWPLPLTAAAGK